jgi:hypothetical protein
MDALDAQCSIVLVRVTDNEDFCEQLAVAEPQVEAPFASCLEYGNLALPPSPRDKGRRRWS